MFRSLAALALLIVLAGTFTLPVAAASGPIAQPPRVSLAAGDRLGTTSIPLHVSWDAATPNGSAIYRYKLQYRRDGGSWTTLDLASRLALGIQADLRGWSVLEFRLRAFDRAGRKSAWAHSEPLWLSTAQEDDDALSLSGGWDRERRSGVLDGHMATEIGGGASATFHFRGQQVGWVTKMVPRGGRASVSIDGGPETTVDLHRARSSTRRLVFAASVAQGKHSLKITALDDGRLNIDAFVVLGAPPDETLVGAGDIALCDSNADELTAAAAAAVPGIVFTVGDNVYPNGAAKYFANCYDPSWGALKSRTKPVIGNHELIGDASASGYFGYFGAAAGKPGKGWYAYEAGTWRVYALNSECSGSVCRAQREWLANDLAANPHRCVAAIWHSPPLSTSRHGDSSRMGKVLRLLYDQGADVLINGHDHGYQRFAPFDADKQRDPGRGLREFIVATGGGRLYDFERDDSLVEVRDNTSHGVLRLDLGPGRYDWQFIPVGDGEFTDSGSAGCH